MERKYLGPTSVEKLIKLIFDALSKKQDKMDEITKEEVIEMWANINASDDEEEEEEEVKPEE